MNETKEERGSALSGLLIAVGIALLSAIMVITGYAIRGGSAQASGTTVQLTTTTKAVHYTPQTRQFTMTIVPQWVHEVTSTYDYLGPEFGKKGLLADKEVWGFSPSTIAVYQGDTVSIDLYNPSSDPHTWTIPELWVNTDIGAPAHTTVSFVASKLGVFTFHCEVGEHFPFMSGQLIVLPATDAPQS